MAATKMFSKLKSSSVHQGGSGSPGFTTSNSVYTLIDSNPISQFFEVGTLIGSSGPELAWKIFEATRKSDRKEASVFFFDKRSAEKLHKPKRKETICDVLRYSARQLDRYRHPKILNLYHTIEENNDTIAFATEPVLGSLANVTGYLLDRLPHNLPPVVREYSFTEFEVKYGILQLSEALIYLHYSCKIIHRNICPQSVIINKKGTWKLAGFEFSQRCSSNDILNPVQCQPFTSKLPKLAQPDLDYMAPECQMQGNSSPQSDMFSLGLLILALYNKGRSPLESNLSPLHYTRQLDALSRNAAQISQAMPGPIQEAVQGLLLVDPRERPTSQHFSMVKYFVDPGVHALQYLDVIQMKDPAHKMTFYHNLKGVLSLIPKKMWFQHILPSMDIELQPSSEVLAAALQPVFCMITELNVEEYQAYIHPIIRNLCNNPKSVQASVTLLENIQILMQKAVKGDFRTDILPMVFSAFESSTPQIQCAAIQAVSHIIDELDAHTIRKTVLPKAKVVLETNGNVHIQATTLSCIEKVIDNLEKTEILDDVLPMLLKAKLVEPVVLMPVVRIYKHMLCDKRFGLTVNLLATKVMPTLTPVVVSPNLKLEEFTLLVELLQDMLEHVSRSQRNKLKLERLSMPSSEKIHQLHRHLDQPIGYPHRPPCLRLESRRTSISVDDVVRRTSGSGASSPDSNFLQVQANLPGRRHSDNTIQPPRIIVGSCSPNGPTSGPGSRRSSFGNLHFRRHSSANPNDPRYNNPLFSNMGFKQSFQAPSTEFIIPGAPSNRSNPTNRRYTAANIFNHTQNASSQLLQTLGSGIQQLFGE